MSRIVIVILIYNRHKYMELVKETEQGTHSCGSTLGAMTDDFTPS
jgi:hypothetical protein